MGDVVLTTGVLAYWNKTHGDTFIVITRKCNASLLENHPAVAETIALTDEQLKTKAWFDFGKELSNKFKDHTLLDLHGTLRSRILSFIWKGEVKRYPKMGLIRRLYDRTHKQIFSNILERTNVPQRYSMVNGDSPPSKLELLPKIHLTNDEIKQASNRLKDVTSKPIIAIHPYATHPAKQWPREHWVKLLEMLEANGLDWIVVGRDKSPLITDGNRDFTNQTNVRETCAILSKTAVLVTGDSGPMHLAAGVGTPVVAMFGPTVKAWGFFPAGTNDTVLERSPDCRPCSLHGGKDCPGGFECMTGIRPERVFEAVRKTLETTEP